MREEIQRGNIYYIDFPYPFDSNRNGSIKKFALVLQSGEYFEEYETVAILLITSDKDAKDYPTSVTIELGTTALNQESYILCSQPYTVKNEIFFKEEVWCAGHLLPEKLDEVDEALYLGLCMGQQHNDNE